MLLRDHVPFSRAQCRLVKANAGQWVIMREVFEAQQGVTERGVDWPQHANGEPLLTRSWRDRDRVLLQLAQVAGERAIHRGDPVQHRLGIVVFGIEAPGDDDRLHDVIDHAESGGNAGERKARIRRPFGDRG